MPYFFYNHPRSNKDRYIVRVGPKVLGGEMFEVMTYLFSFFRFLGILYYIEISLRGFSFLSLLSSSSEPIFSSFSYKQWVSLNTGMLDRMC